MKKLLIATITTVLSVGAWASQSISVVWPWALGDTDAQYSRSVMEHINKQQKEINFLFDTKPGAGASIAAMHVAKTPNSIMAASSAFFVRPNFYSDGVHNINDFQPLMLMCSGPLVIVSGKHKSWAEVPRDQPLNIGLAGPGTTSHLVGEIIRQRFPQAIIVPYKSTNEPLIETIAGRIDFAVGFIPAAEQYLDTGRVHGLGVTGPSTVRNIPSLHQQGFANASTVVNHHSWLVPKSMPREQFIALQNLVLAAARSPEVREDFKKLHCEPRALVADPATQWFNTQITHWRDLSKKALANSK
jgi:tripartite-type tricarboxylate transporter receptor subunit TctC